MEHPVVRQRRWARRFFLRQVGISLVVMLGLVFARLAWISFALGALVYLLAQALFIFFCFGHKKRTEKKWIQAFYWGEGLKLLLMAGCTLVILRLYHLQMLFFLLGWVVPHFTHVWGVFFCDTKRDRIG